jgi:hypothetical protein
MTAGVFEKMNYRFFISICLGLILNLAELSAQPINRGTHNWVFGNSQQYIRFNRVSTKPELINGKFVPFGRGGSATVSDPVSGALLFYSDASSVYDATHQLMPQGIGLSGNPNSNQPVVVCPVPGQAGKYFLFTNDATSATPGTVRYSVVDMSLFGNSATPLPAYGDVDPAIKNQAVTGVTGVSEAMMIIPNSNGTDFWLINQISSTQSYLVTRITAASLTGTFTTLTISGPVSYTHLTLPTSP